MPRDRGKMLVIRGGAIGDFILTLPALAALRETFEETHIEVLGYPYLAELAKSAGIIEAYKSIESGPLAGFFGRNAKLNEEWMNYFSSFNLILSYLYDPDQIFQTNVGRSTKAQFIVGPHRPIETENLHATRVFLKPLEKLAIFDPDPVPKLPLPRTFEPNQSARPFRLAIHPGSGSAKKNWPVPSWEAFLKLILDQTPWEVLIVGGEAEIETMDRLRRFSSPRTEFASRQPLLETARLLSGCDYFVGHDSGITHLAGALGLPLLALWGPSNLEIWQPQGPKTDFIRNGSDLSSIAAQDVFTRLLSLIQ